MHLTVLCRGLQRAVKRGGVEAWFAGTPGHASNSASFTLSEAPALSAIHSGNAPAASGCWAALGR